MKKKRMNRKKAEQRWEREDEVLDLKELMNVEGGTEKENEEKEKNVCLTLGCYSLEVPPLEDGNEIRHEV